jgi:hypothetical protein
VFRLRPATTQPFQEVLALAGGLALLAGAGRGDGPVKCPDMAHGVRLTAYSAVSTSLALRSDRGLQELVETAVPIGSGIGGKSALMEVAGIPVFVKRVPLTDRERQPENVRSTANLFELPVFCQ